MAIAISNETDYLMTAVDTTVLSDIIPGTYRFEWDLGPMGAADTIVINVKLKIRGTGVAALGVSQTFSFSNVQAVPVKTAIEVLQAKTGGQILISASQSAGTLRTCAFSMARIV